MSDRQPAVRKQIVIESFVGATYFKCDVPWAGISIATEEDKWPSYEAERVEASIKRKLGPSCPSGHKNGRS
jgi:hypothetical protein